jgi:hypothetical protein
MAFIFAGNIHHMNWFKDGSVLVGYLKVSSTTDSYSVYSSSLGILSISKSNPGSFAVDSFNDLCNPVCWLPPTDEADQQSYDQKYMTRFISEWYVRLSDFNQL